MKPGRESRRHAIGRHAFIITTLHEGDMYLWHAANKGDKAVDTSNDRVNEVTERGQSHHHLNATRSGASNSGSESTKHGVASR
eukprot:5598807-Amphidinium_carterae.1